MYRLLQQAAWAPIGVVVLHAVVARTAYRQDLDWLMHSLGGAAMAFFLYEATRVWERYLGRLYPLARYLIAFGLTCAVAIGWEVAEFFLGNQGGLGETIADLIFGMLGAGLTVTLMASQRPSRG